MFYGRENANYIYTLTVTRLLLHRISHNNLNLPRFFILCKFHDHIRKVIHPGWHSIVA